MARTVEIDEPERRLLLRLAGDEWDRLDRIRHERGLNNDPILKEQEDIQRLLDRLK